MIYVVSGMARTGTSMMMNALSEGGLPAIYDGGKNELMDKKRTPDYDPNHDGLFELFKERLYRMWPVDLNGYLVKVADFQWEKLPEADENSVKVIYMRRNLDSVLKSFMALIGAADKEQTVLRWKRQKKIIEQIGQRLDVENIKVFWYESILERPAMHFSELMRSGWPIDPIKAVAVVNPDYCHFRQAVTV
jgi:hypothetical protein